MEPKKSLAVHEFVWNLPPSKLSLKDENDPLENIHQSLSLWRELSSILVVSEAILLKSRIAQILKQPHMAPTRMLGVLQLHAHQIWGRFQFTSLSSWQPSLKNKGSPTSCSSNLEGTFQFTSLSSWHPSWVKHCSYPYTISSCFNLNHWASSSTVSPSP